MNRRSGACRKYLLAALVVTAISGTAHAETSIGRWCDESLPGMPQYNSILEIVVADNGAAEMRIRNADGSRTVTTLEKQGFGIYAAIGSSTGDKYRVEPDGNLALLNYKGFARLAMRLDSTPKRGDCAI
jgi:hypothetical protein